MLDVVSKLYRSADAKTSAFQVCASNANARSTIIFFFARKYLDAKSTEPRSSVIGNKLVLARLENKKRKIIIEIPEKPQTYKKVKLQDKKYQSSVVLIKEE